MKTYVKPSVFCSQIKAITAILSPSNPTPGENPGVTEEGSSGKVAARLYV